MNPVKQDWKDIQEKAFTNWTNNVLKEGGVKSKKGGKLQIDSLKDDLQDGLVLIALLETLGSPKKVGPYNRNPRIKPQLMENLTAIFKFLSKENIKTVGIGPGDIFDKNKKLIMGLIWTLIRCYQMKMKSGAGMSSSAAILSWVNAQIPDHKVGNFKKDWNDGIAVCHLVGRLRPGSIPNLENLKSSNGLENCKLGMKVAESQLGIPMIISPEDMNNPNVDDLSIMTYLSYFTKVGNKILLMWIQSLLPQQNITNLTTDWNSGINLAALLNAISPGLLPDWREWDPHHGIDNISKCMSVAEQVFGVKSTLKPVEMANPDSDELLIAGYLIAFMIARPVDTTRTITAYGPGLKHASVGKGTYFHVDISRAGGKGNIEVTIQNSVVTTQQEPGQVGQIRVNFTPRTGGKMPIEVRWNGQHILGSPYHIDVLDMETLSVDGYKTGMAIAVDKSFSFYVRGVTGSHGLVASVRHPGGSDIPKIIQRGKGDFEVSYVPTRLGNLEFDLRLGEIPIYGSPFMVGIVDPSQCQIVLTEPTETNTLLMGRPAHFQIKADDVNMRGLSIEVQTPIGSKYLQPLLKKKGLYTTTYTPGEIGEHTVIATCGGELITGSPLALNVVSSGKCSFVTPVPRYIALGSTTTLKISTKQAGNAEVVCQSGNPSVISAQLKPDVGGLYNLMLSPKCLGEAEIFVTFAGVPLEQSPFPLGVADPTQCSLTDPNVVDIAARVKQTTEFLVHVAAAGRGEMKVKAKGPNSIVGGEVKDNRDGTYRVRVTPTEEGKHTVDVLWCGFHIPGSPFTWNVLKMVPLKAFSLEGEAFRNCVAGRAASGLLRAPEPGLLPRFSIRIEGEGLYCNKLSATQSIQKGEIQCVIQDNGDCTYYVSYFIPKPGKFAFSIMVEGQNIPLSPFQIVAHPPPDAEGCHMIGEMLEPNKYFSIQKPIEFKLDVTYGGAGQLVVKGKDPMGKEEPLYTSFETYGTQKLYTIRFAPRTIGNYTCELFWDNTPVRGSPYTFRVVDPMQCKLTGLPHYDYLGRVNNAIEFFCDTRNAGMGAPYTVVVEHRDKQEDHFEISPAGEIGVFKASYVPKSSGFITVIPRYNNDPLLYESLKLEVVNPSHYTVTPPATMGKLKEYVKFPIEGITKETKPLTLKATHPNHNATVKTDPKGELQIGRFTPKYTGTYLVEVMIAGGHITNSPFQVDICDPVSCKIIGGFPSVLLVGVPQIVTFNCNSAGPGKLSVHAECSSGPLTIESEIIPKEDGVFDIRFESSSISNNKVTIKWGDFVICNSPFPLNVVDTSNVTFKCPNLRNNSFAYTSEVFEIWMDSAQSGGVKPEVVARGPRDQYSVKIKAGKANNYIASFTPWQVGENSVEILIGGKTVVNTPFTFDSVKRIDPRLVQVNGQSLKRCVSQKKQELSIVTPEQGLLESGRLVASIAPLSKAKTTLDVDYELVDNNNGNYILTFMVPEIASYVLKITIDEQSLKGSPFTLKGLPPPSTDKIKLIGVINDKNAAFKVGQAVEFQIDVTDAGIGDLAVTVTDDYGNEEIVDIQEIKKGGKRTVYNVRFFPRALGRYTVVVTWGDVPLPRSPYTVYICDPSKCIFTELPDPLRITPMLNQPFTITCDTREGGKGQFKSFIKYKNGDVEDLEIIEGEGEREGVYTISVVSRRLGEIQVHALFNGFPLLNPPWTDDVADPGGFSVIPPMGIWKRHAYVKFNVFGIQPTTRNVVVKAYHPEHDAVVTMEFAEGHGIAQFTPKYIGDYTIEAYCAGAPMGGSPFAVPVCDPAGCRIVGEVPEILISGREIRFIVDGEDAGPGELSVSSQIYSGYDPITVALERKSDVSYTVIMNPHDVGMAKVTLKWSNFNLPQFPLDVKIIDVDRCTISLPQMINNNFLSGETFEVSIDAREVGSVAPEVNLLGPQGPYQGSLIDHKNGTFTASFIPWQEDRLSKTSKHRLEILFAGVLVSSCPFEFNVVRPLDVSKMGINPSQLGNVVAGQRTNILLVCHETGLLERGAIVFSAKPLELDNPVPAAMEPIEITIKDNGNGTYTGYFTLPFAGTYTFECFVDGKHVNGSPCTVFCQRGPETENVKVSGIVLDSTTAITLKNVIEFILDIEDAGFGQLTVSAEDHNSTQTAVYTKDGVTNKRKIRKVRIDITHVATYSVGIFWGGEHVQGSPFKFDVVSPEDTVVNGLPLPNNGTIALGHPISFAIDTLNGGNVEPEVIVTTAGEQGEVMQSFSREGTIYFYKLETLQIGTIIITIKMGGIPVPGSPFRCIIVDPSMYGITGIDLSKKAALINQPVNFGVKGAFSDNLKMQALAHGPGATIDIESIKQSDNYYQSSFTPVEPGVYNVFVEYGGDGVAGSPFPVPVVDPSRVEILGTIPSYFHVSEDEEMVIKVRGAGQGDVRILINGLVNSPLMSTILEDRGQDTYSIVFKPKQVGTAKVDIQYGGYTIPQCPFSLEILNSALCVVNCEVFKECKSVIGDPIQMQIVCEAAGKGELEIRAKGRAAQSLITLTKEEDEVTYNGEFIPWETGEHTVEILWGTRHVPGSPFLIVITMSDTETVKATGEGLISAVAGEEAMFTVLTNEIGLADKGLLSVTVKGIQKMAAVTIKDNNDGTYAVTYVAPSPGAYIVGIFYRNKSIKGSPFKINVESCEPKNVVVYGPAMHPNSIHISGVPLELYVDATKAGAGKLQVAIRGPNDYRPKVYETKDSHGVYSLKFDALVSGRYLVFVLWSKVQVPNSPFKLKVYPAPDASKVTAYGPGLEDGLLGTDGEFFIETREAGIGSLSIRVHGLKDGFKVDAQPLPDDSRTLSCTYSPLRAGEYVIFIRWSGHHIPGSPFRVRIFKPKQKRGEVPSSDEESEVVNPLTAEIIAAKGSNVMSVLQPVGVGVLDPTLPEDVAYLGKKKLPKEGRTKKKVVRKSSSKGELKQVTTVKSGQQSYTGPVDHQMLIHKHQTMTVTGGGEAQKHQTMTITEEGEAGLQYNVEVQGRQAVLTEQDMVQQEAIQQEVLAEIHQQEPPKKKTSFFGRLFSKKKSKQPDGISEEPLGSQAIIAEQKDEMETKKVITIAYSGDQPPELDQLVRDGQISSDMLKVAEVRFVRDDTLQGSTDQASPTDSIPVAPPPAYQRTRGETQNVEANADMQLEVVQDSAYQVGKADATVVEEQVQTKKRVTITYSGEEPPDIDDLVREGKIPRHLAATAIIEFVRDDTLEVDS